MAGNGSLSANQARVIPLLLQGFTVREIAEKTAIGERTIYRWKSEDVDFREALRAAAESTFSEGLAYLRGALPDAVQVLHDAMKGEDMNVKLKAADRVCTFALKAWEIAQDEDLVEQLRDQLRKLQDARYK